jgi:hypothetical protein
MNQPENGCMQFTPTFLQRIGYKLFPHRGCEMPVESLKVCRDGIICKVKCSVSFMDRVRILFTGRVEVDVLTATENEVGACKTESSFNVLPLKILQ